MPGYMKHRTINGDECSLSVSPGRITLECYLLSSGDGAPADCIHIVDGDAVAEFCEHIGIENVDGLLPLLSEYKDPDWREFHATISKHQTADFIWPIDGSQNPHS